jgi:CubicO group peptidase (beta-lactamase class C family)
MGTNYTRDADFLEYSTKPQSQEQMITRFAGFEPQFRPDRKYSYSNTNYMLLGYIIDRLNLKNTHLGSAIDTDKNQAQSFYYSRSDWQIKKQWHMSTAFAAGAIISSPQDLNLFSKALMSGKLVSKTSLKMMLSSSYAYGKGIRKYRFYRRYSHGHYGLIEGFHSALMYFPEEDMSFAISGEGEGYTNPRVQFTHFRRARKCSL